MLSLRTREVSGQKAVTSGTGLAQRKDNIGTGTMKIKKGDKVKMLAGKDRGKTGKVLFAFPTDNKIVVEGLNLIKRHQRARKQGQKGQIVHKERAINTSSAQLICNSCAKPARIGYRFEGETKVRYCKQCQATI